MLILETKRLIIRKFIESDLDDFNEYAKVEGVGEMAGWPHHKSIEESRKILNMFIKSSEEFAVVYKVTNKVIGSIGVHKKSDEHFNNFNVFEIGYVLSKDYWGQGLMVEGVKRIIRYAFCHLDMDVLICGHFVLNNQSRRVCEKLGFIYYKDHLYEASLLNKAFDAKKYYLNKESYLKENLTNTSNLLNKEVRVLVDRPINSYHPNYNNIKYELNYGYIENTLSLDGEEVDCYIIGINTVVEEFTGVCKAIIKRLDDNEDKLIICPKEYTISALEIKEKTKFMEQFFSIKIIMGEEE